MSTPAMYSGQEIKTFIPQREPMMMVDKLYSANETSVETGLTIAANNIFVDGKLFSESGMIEHIAQSAACFAGYNDWINKRPIVLGYIAEIKKFALEKPAHVGDELKSSLTVVSNAMNITLMNAETTINGQLAASCKIKIFMDKR
ncbi:MAG: hydroxymyristoyl-ACP dehydratase [Bacteroidales bacterium]|jgi:3-hydroxymyristoyl/3-hydroxydecanoyl-(acyl carrier protein) dehydratase|nr:hydroxymyristoyl-ACP dehydratase [Bacteroidales bacterium]